MGETQPWRTIGSSILAVLAGFVVVVILSMGTDMVLHAIGVFPSLSEPGSFTTPLLLLATVYRSIYSVAGSYLAARLAPNRPMGHALILGVVGLVASIAGLVIMGGAGHVWYPIALVVLAIPCAWLGGALYHTRHPDIRTAL